MAFFCHTRKASGGIDRGVQCQELMRYERGEPKRRPRRIYFHHEICSGCCTPGAGEYARKLSQHMSDTTIAKYRVLHVCIYLCMVITYSKVKDQPGKVANPAPEQLNGEY